MSNLWNNETPVTQYDLNVPAWIEQDISPCDIAAIIQDGCASDAYMPAVTYWSANKTMAEHGDDVLQFIQDTYGELPKPNDDESWSGMAVFYLSIAVELWASSIENELSDAIDGGDDDDDDPEGVAAFMAG